MAAARAGGAYQRAVGGNGVRGPWVLAAVGGGGIGVLYAGCLGIGCGALWGSGAVPGRWGGGK